MIAKLTGKDNLWMRLIRAAVLVVMAVVIMMSFTTTAFADDEHDKDFSFYKIASAAATYYDDTHNDASDNYEKFNHDSGINMEKAGALVGFIDEDYDSGFIGSTVSFLSSSSQSRGYKSFSEPGVQAYVQYGHALQSLGLDSTANDAVDLMAVLRGVAGLVLLLSYSVALFADIIFGALIGILQAFNPFAWFMAGAKGVSEGFAKWFGATPSDMSESFPMFDGISQFVSEWYTALSDLGMYLTFLLFFITLGVGLIMWNSQKNKVKTVFRTFATRLIFICVGIPLLGGLYTASLDLAAKSSWTEGGTPAANYVLASTLVDFESWAENNNLALPSGVTITVDTTNSTGGSVDAGRSTSVRGIARAVNRQSNSLGSASLDSGWNLDWKEGNKATELSENSTLKAFNLIGRYMSASFYHASDYETAYKARMAKNGTSDGFYSQIQDVTSDWKQYLEGTSGGSLFSPNHADVSKMPYLTDGKSSSFGDGDVGPVIEENTITYKGKATLFGLSGNSGSNAGLTSLSMYNYLTTEFDDSSVVTYSSKKATSGMVTHSHRSVNLVGDGLSSVLYYFNTLSIFGSIIVIGLGYSLALLFNMLGRGIKMVSSVPFAMLGNMRSMAKVCTYVAMMVIEVLGTFFVYSLVIEILMSLSALVETPVMEALQTHVDSTLLAGVPAASTFGNVSQIIIIVGTLLSSVIYIWFAFKAMKLRKSIVKTLDEGVANMIDRLFTTDKEGGSMSNAAGAGSNIVKKPSIGERAKDAGRAAGGAVMAGAGMAAGQMLATKAGDKLGLTAGSVDEEQKDGTAENAGGADQEDIADGGQIQGAERQGLPGSDGPDGTRHALPAPPSDGDDHTGQAIMAADVESLGDVRSDEVGGVQAGESARPGEVEHETTNVAVSDDDVAQVDASNVDAKQAAVDTELARAAGQTTAMEDERDDELKSKERKAAAKDAVKGVAKTAEGGAKVAAGYATGNAELMAEGAQDAAKGAAKTAKAGQRAADAGAKVDAARQQKTEQKKALSQGGQGPAKPGQSGARPGGQSGHAKPAKTGAPSRAASPAKQDTRVSSTVNAVGGASTVLNKGGDMRVNATQKGAQAPKQSPKLAAQLDKLGRQQAALKQAEKQVLATGKATLPNGKVVRNVADVRQMQRSLAQKSKAVRSGVEHASTVASLGAAKRLTDKKKKDDDSFF